jgi:hypothetical protein
MLITDESYEIGFERRFIVAHVTDPDGKQSIGQSIVLFAVAAARSINLCSI